MTVYVLEQEAQEAYDWAFDLGIVDDTVDKIVEIVLDQEIVSYCSDKGTVSFDVYDLVETF